MADLTQFIGISAHSTQGGGDQIIGTWTGTETEYAALDDTNFVNYDNTIFFIQDDE